MRTEQRGGEGVKITESYADVIWLVPVAAVPTAAPTARATAGPGRRNAVRETEMAKRKLRTINKYTNKTQGKRTCPCIRCRIKGI